MEGRELDALRSVLRERLPYMKVYTDVSVYTEEKTTRVEMINGRMVDVPIQKTMYVVVEYNKPKLNFMNQNGFERIEFPILDLNKRLEHYRNKLKYEREKFNTKQKEGV